MLAGYASDQREDIKEMIEDEEESLPLKKKSEELEEFKLIE